MTPIARLLTLFSVTVLMLGSVPPSVAGAQTVAQDWSIEGGRFYTQTSGNSGTGGITGFAVVDDDDAQLWREFRRLGGVRALGYPVSSRFRLDGFIVQATEKAVLQWRPEHDRADLYNVLDRLHDRGFDVWLRDTQLIPRQPTFDDEQGLTFEEVVAKRQALLDEAPAIRERYFAVPDPLQTYGLPTSAVEDVGPALAVRFQRAAIYEWQEQMPFAEPGEVTFAYVGDLARRPEIGLVPTDAAKPVPSPPRRPVSDLSDLVLAIEDAEIIFEGARLEEVPLDGPTQPGVVRRLFRNAAIVHGPFVLSSVVAGYESEDAASAALAQVSVAGGEAVELPQVGDESFAVWQLDGGDSMAHATYVVWRRGPYLQAIGAAGFDPVASADDLALLAIAVDERSASAEFEPDELVDGTPALTFEDLWALRPAPLAIARTSVAGSSADRMTNLRVATQHLNNVVVQPGQELSLNETVGPTTEERGFKMGYAIIGTDTVPDVGGGICQVSTTLFQASFKAGLEITERNAHSYWIPRYAIAGLDATVYAPSVDFKFRNDTSGRIILQGWPAGGELVFAIYGEAPPRDVEIYEPVISGVVEADREVVKRYSTRLAVGEQVQVETAQDGFNVSVERIVREGDRELHHDFVTSNYRPASTVLLIGGEEPTVEAPVEQPSFIPRPGGGISGN